jgi:SAM-dependent methyltransferase
MSIFPRVNHQRLGQLNDAGVDVSDKSILDYGGNRGNLLEDGVEADVIKPENYTSMDVSPTGLTLLKDRYPDTNTQEYNRYNQVYNIHGEKLLPFPFDDNTFDMVYSYSVNTHSSWDDYKFDISEMVRVTKGPVYTSILDISCIEILRDKRVRDFGWAVGLHNFNNIDTGKYFINHDTVIDIDEHIPEGIEFLLTVYNPQWLISEISKMGLEARVLDKPQPGIQPLLEIRG